MKKPSQTKYLLGVVFFVISLLLSSVNDVLTKYLSSNIPAIEVVFLRFFFSTLTLLPFMLKGGLGSFYTSRPLMHLARGVLLCGGIFLWCIGLNTTQIAIATVIGFTMPLFVLVLSRVFLKEKLTLPKLAATILGFVGITIIVQPFGVDINYSALILVCGAFMFSCLDVLNKKFVNNESTLSMLFYSGFFTMLFSFVLVPLTTSWVMPSARDLALFVALGIGANLLLYFLLKAFSIAEASALAPYRYTELMFSMAFGYIIFGEFPKHYTIIGAIVIIASLIIMQFYNQRGKSKDLVQL